MKVLLAGATGALGILLMRALIANGHEVIGLGRTPGKRDELLELGARPLIADVMDRAALLNAVDGLGADAVLHEMTALKKIPTRHRDMAATDALREVGTANLLAAARLMGARRFVTQSFFMGYGYGDWGDKVLTEDDPFAPPGRDKFEQDLAMRSTERQTFTADGIEGIALRYGSLYGPGGATEPIIEMLRRRRLPVPRGGGGITSLIYVEDAAAATVAALERGRSGEAYNVADDEPVRWGEFFGALAKGFGAPPPREVLPRWVFRFMPYARAMMLGDHRISNAKAKRELGWTPSVPTYREGVSRLAEALGGRG